MTQFLVLANALLEQQTLGIGLLSPLQLDPGLSDLARVAGGANVQQCIYDLIDTKIGERLMNEDFGTTASGALFENIEGVVHALPPIIQLAIQQWEPRVFNVSAIGSIPQPNVVNILVGWTLKATNKPGNLVYPYYLLGSSQSSTG
jgi:phage baseplate assembly protein W